MKYVPHSNPSSHWTQKERNDVMMEILILMRPHEGDLAFPSKINRTIDRLRFLIAESAETLENNREAILEGFEKN